MSTDWNVWHEEYDDSRSPLSRRLAYVQGHIRDWLDSTTGPVRITSLCSGDGRDVLQVLAERDDAGRAEVTLIDLGAGNVARAHATVAREALQHIDIRHVDGSDSDALVGAVPADLLLVCGVFGNISDGDVHRLISALPAMCAQDAVVLWTRGRWAPDLTVDIRRWLAEGDFVEESFTGPADVEFSVGRHRFTGQPQPLVQKQKLFTFLR